MWAYNISVTSELHMKVAQYLHSEILLAEFEDWFYSNLGDLMVLPPSTELYLAGEIQLGLAEASNGDITEDQFRENLAALAERDVTFIFSGASSPAYSVSTGAGISSTIVSGNIISDDIILPVPA